MPAMWFSKQLPLGGLVELCRALRHSLGAGLTLRDVFRQQARRGHPSVRPVAERVGARLDQGESLEEALAGEPGVFPTLFIDLAVVAENTGRLPEVFGELEDYYRTQQSLRRQLRIQITPPIIQFVAAIFVVAAMLYILGAIAESRNTEAADPVGLGLKGRTGALVFLGVVFGLIGFLIGGYWLLTRSLRKKAAVHEFLLRLPAIGPCLHALALGRFTLALHATQETGMSITRALALSLRATGNEAYVARTASILEAVRQGDDLTLALTRSKIFPEDFLSIMAVAEESGQIAEVMARQAKYYQEEAGRRLTILTRVAGYGVWVAYAVFMVILIFRIAGFYLNALQGK
jgi:type IV pilus assembly protein PilC